MLFFLFLPPGNKPDRHLHRAAASRKSAENLGRKYSGTGLFPLWQPFGLLQKEVQVRKAPLVQLHVKAEKTGNHSDLLIGWVVEVEDLWKVPVLVQSRTNPNIWMHLHEGGWAVFGSDNFVVSPSRVSGKKSTKRTKSINGPLYVFRGRINTEVMEVENVEDGTGLCLLCSLCFGGSLWPNL